MDLSYAQKRTLTWLGITAAFVLLLWLLAPVLSPFLVGAVLAYALQPAVERIVRRGVPRIAAVLLVELVVFFALLAMLLLVVPVFSKEVPLLREKVPLFFDRLSGNVLPWLSQYSLNVPIDLVSLKTMALSVLNANFEGWSSALLSSAKIGGSFLLAALGFSALVPLVTFYLLMDWHSLVLRIRLLIPPHMREQTHEIVTEIDTVLGQYLRGQALVMLILSIFYSTGLALWGFDLALPLGLFTGLAVFIPYVGFGAGLLFAVLASLLQFLSWYGILAVAVVYGLGQLVESFYLTPRFVGQRIGMHPLAVIFALLAFGHLFGFVGVLVALPVSAVLVVAVRRLQQAYLKSALYAA